jgi:hypothetical protein
MPRYTAQVGHYLVLETSVVTDALDARQARGIVENIRDRGTFGSIDWKIKDSPMTEGRWRVAYQRVEIETVQEPQE